MSSTPIALIFRLLVLAAMTGHVFLMYGLARTMGEGFGFSWQGTIVAALFALVLLIPLLWAIGIPELPEIYVRVWRARRWWEAGCCPQCGYPRGEGDHATCNECGADLAAPEPYRFGRGTAVRFAWMLLAAWLAGCAGSECWLLADEIAFRREVETASASSLARPRRWPNGDVTLVHDAAAPPDARFRATRAP